jgi:hypothetical protein
MKPAKILVLSNEAEWHTMYDALSQFVENTKDHLSNLDDPVEEDQLSVRQLEIAERFLESFDADLANLTEENS